MIKYSKLFNMNCSFWKVKKKFTSWKINILQYTKFLNIFGIQIISKNKNKKFEDKTIFRYFNIRNFKIPKYRSFYISSFQILNPTPACNELNKRTSKLPSPIQKIILMWINTTPHGDKNLDAKKKYIENETLNFQKNDTTKLLINQLKIVLLIEYSNNLYFLL